MILYFTFLHKNPVYISLVPHTCHMERVSLAPWFNLSRNEIMELVIIPFSPLLPTPLPPTSYISPITLSIFKQPPTSTAVFHHYPQNFYPTLAIHTNSDVSFIETFIETSVSQFVFHCLSANKFWLHLNFLCSISFTFKVMSEIKSHASRNGFLASCYSRSFLWWPKQPQLGVFMAHGPASINMLS